MSDYDRPYRTSGRKRKTEGKSSVTLTQMIVAAAIIAAVCIVKITSPSSFSQMELLFEEIMADNRTYEKVAEVFNSFGSGVPVDDLAADQDGATEEYETYTDESESYEQNQEMGIGAPEEDTEMDLNPVPTAVVFPASFAAASDDDGTYGIEPPASCTYSAFALTTEISYPLECDGEVSSEFGYRDDPFTGDRSFHKGIDIAAPHGTAILAAFDGMVIETGENDSSGKYVLVQHDNGLVTAYYHCSRICTELGMMVRHGEKIAEVGSTGNSTGPHLHFEIRIDGVRYDPAYVL